MEISSGIIFIKNEQILLCHATNTPYWGIPKGHIDEGETALEAALREVKEETNFDVKDPEELIDLGEHFYYKGKNMHLFLYDSEHFPDAETCVCTSMYTKYGKTFPENDQFKWVDLNDISKYCSKSQAKLLIKVLDL
ncbi:nudix hydrolase [Proteus phage phiP4-3]|uniref:Nudix hydrolase n=1 Tax=Proteus phage phiP4-3 TaxID=2065203 RepID=A0A2I6PFL2_9CAUD|nr:nudix hydrolase [Proteus phage phiP4-3]AUM58519.1 nudix hydrolase [Proteus phage phiP4-3]AZV01239.1 nudix hydrolase [Shigella phage vB_SdyM_006]